MEPMTLEQKRALARARARAKAGRGQVEDIAKSSARGGITGIEDVLGATGNVTELSRSAGEWLAGKMGATPEAVEEASQFSRQLPVGNLPTSEDISGFRKEYIGDIAPPQTRAGEVAETVSKYLPNALIPASRMGRVSNVLGPGLGEEAGAEVARRTIPELEGPARLIGSTGGAFVSTQPSKTGFIKAGTKKKQVDAAYDEIRKAGVNLNQFAGGRITNEMRKAADKAGMDVRLSDHKNMIERVETALSYLKDPDGRYMPLDFNHLQAARRTISNGFVAGANDNNRLLRKMTDAFDEAVDKLRPSDFAGPNRTVSKEVLEKWREARKLNTQFRKAERMQQVHDNAMNAVGANYTDAKYNTAVKQQLRGLAKDDFKRARFFTKDEKNMILKIVRGAPEGGDVEQTRTIENMLRDFGKKYGGSGKVGAIQTATQGTSGAGLTYMLTGDPKTAAAVGLVAGPGMNYLGNKAGSLAEDLASHKFNNLRNVVAGGSPAAWGPRKIPQAAMKTLPYNYRDEN